MTQTRLDKWLFHARFCRTRTLAQAAIEGGKVRIHGQRVRKPGHVLRPGDVLTLTLGGIVRVVRVLDVAERRGGVEAAQALFETLPED